MDVRCAICGVVFHQEEHYLKHYQQEHSELGVNSLFPLEDAWLFRIASLQEREAERRTEVKLLAKDLVEKKSIQELLLDRLPCRSLHMAKFREFAKMLKDGNLGHRNVK